MRFTAAIAGLMTVMLISVSCAATVCTLKCDLHQLPPGCHHGADGERRMMGGMGMEMKLCPMVHPAPPHELDGLCTRPGCVESPAQRPGEVDAGASWNSIEQARIPAAQPPPTGSLPDHSSDRPLSRSDLASLQMILRV